MKYGLIGGKLGHSFSKIIHEKIRDIEYELKELSEQELEAFMKEYSVPSAPLCFSHSTATSGCVKSFASR